MNILPMRLLIILDKFENKYVMHDQILSIYLNHYQELTYR
jgi:hypothetical protein